MNGYTKLFGSIVASTIWQEDDHTRIVWITMLAMANQHGEVEASVPGLAKFANTSLEATEAALSKLLSPDKYSRSKEFEGRRIEIIDGGWIILNHGKYRAKSSLDEKREMGRIRVERHRLRNAPVTLCNDSSSKSSICNAPVTLSDDKQKQIAEADAYTEAEKTNTPLPPEGGSSSEEIKITEFSIYDAYPLKVGKPKALASIKKAMSKESPARLLEITKAYAARRAGDLAFVPHPATWFNQERYNDDPSTWARDNQTKPQGKKPDYTNGFAKV